MNNQIIIEINALSYICHKVTYFEGLPSLPEVKKLKSVSVQLWTFGGYPGDD